MLGYGWLGYARCPPQPQMIPGMPAFWAPAGAQPRRLTRGRAHAPEAQETAAKKEQIRSQSGNANATKHPQARPETQMQQNTVISSVLWLGSRARARQKARKPTGKKQGPRSARASHSKAKRTEQQPNAQRISFWRYLQCFVERGPSIAGMPRLYPSDSASWVERQKEVLMMQPKLR